MAVRLNNREKYAVFVMTLCIGFFIIFQFVVFPLIDQRDRLTRAIQVKKNVLTDLRILRGEYQEIGKQAELTQSRFAGRESGFTLFSFLDRLAGRAGIKDQIIYMKPSTITAKNGKNKMSLVEMKVQGVTFNRLIPYLQLVETSKNVVYIRRISISKTDKKEGFINAVMQIEAAEIFRQ